MIMFQQNYHLEDSGEGYPELGLDWWLDPIFYCVGTPGFSDQVSALGYLFGLLIVAVSLMTACGCFLRGGSSPQLVQVPCYSASVSLETLAWASQWMIEEYPTWFEALWAIMKLLEMLAEILPLHCNII